MDKAANKMIVYFAEDPASCPPERVLGPYAAPITSRETLNHIIRRCSVSVFQSLRCCPEICFTPVMKPPNKHDSNSISLAAFFTGIRLSLIYLLAGDLWLSLGALTETVLEAAGHGLHVCHAAGTLSAAAKCLGGPVDCNQFQKRTKCTQKYLQRRILDAGYPHEAHCDFWQWKDLFPQRRHKVCVLSLRLPKLAVPLVCRV